MCQRWFDEHFFKYWSGLLYLHFDSLVVFFIFFVYLCICISKWHCLVSANCEELQAEWFTNSIYWICVSVSVFVFVYLCISKWHCLVAADCGVLQVGWFTNSICSICGKFRFYSNIKPPDAILSTRY